jgi:hypothetical protein
VCRWLIASAAISPQHQVGVMCVMQVLGAAVVNGTSTSQSSSFLPASGLAGLQRLLALLQGGARKHAQVSQRCVSVCCVVLRVSWLVVSIRY